MPERVPDAVATGAAARVPRLLDAAHVGLLTLLIGVRPLVWDGDPTLMPNLAYLLLVILALGLVVGECWAGVRRELRWSVDGLVLAALVAVLLPAALRSPLPVPGWSLWGMLAVHLGLAAYLMQVLRGRERLALAALGAGLAGEALVAAGQYLWELPALAREQAQGKLIGLEASPVDIVERIANGGLYGSFTLSNTLAAYLLLAVPPLVGAALDPRGQRAARALALTIAALSAAVFVATWSKGAIVALAAAVALQWWWRHRGWRCWLPLAAVALVGCAALLMPGPRHSLQASADVRLGYWRGAVELVRQAPLAGHGLESYQEHAAQVLAPEAEWSRHVHDEPLETAVDGGLVAAALLVVLLVRLLGPVRTIAHDRIMDPPPGVVAAAGPIALAAGVAYLGLLGLLEGNFMGWPGGESMLGRWGLGAALGVAIAGACALLARLPPPPGWSVAVALSALAIHTLVDFDLHSAAIWATVMVCAMLGGGRASRWVPTGGRRVAALGIGSAAVAALLVAWILACVESGRLRTALDIVADVKAITSPGRLQRDEAEITCAYLAAAAGEPAPEPGITGRPVDLQRLLVAALTAAQPLADHDYQTRSQILALLPPGEAREPSSRSLCALEPWSAVPQGLLARDCETIALAHERAGHPDPVWWREALAHARRSLELSPSNLRPRLALADLCARAAPHLPEEAEALRAEERAQRQRIAELAPIVHFRNRLDQ